MRGTLVPGGLGKKLRYRASEKDPLKSAACLGPADAPTTGFLSRQRSCTLHEFFLENRSNAPLTLPLRLLRILHFLQATCLLSCLAALLQSTITTVLLLTSSQRISASCTIRSSRSSRGFMLTNL